MKTKFSILTLAVIASGALVFTGCNGDDLSTPTIVLDGDNPMIIELGGTYTEPGFTATDDQDGDISANVTADDNIVTSQIGEYEVTYTVADKAGNVGTETRVVRVVMNKAAYLGTYSVHEICDMDNDGTYGEAGEVFDYTVTVSSGGDVNELLFSNFGAYGTTVVVPVYYDGDLNDALSVDDYILPGTTIHFSATGTVTMGTLSGVEFDLDYSATDGADSVPCQSTYTKL